MSATAETMFGAIDAWQAMLDRHRLLFGDMVPGSRVGIVPRDGSGVLPGKHAGALRSACGTVEMLSWEAQDGGMRADVSLFPGIERAQVDLLFVADDTALETLQAQLQADALTAMKRLIRQGAILFYVMRNKHELQDAGYEDFLESLGLAFLGACR